MNKKDDFDQLKGPIHRLMGEFFKDLTPFGFQADQAFHPPMDIYETHEHLVVVLEIAGMRAEDIHVTFEKDTLSIRGLRREIQGKPKTRLHQMEIDYGPFARTLRIPFPLEVDGFKATYQQGFLIITVPKRMESASRSVEVKIR
jgi:HSP20 family protein